MDIENPKKGVRKWASQDDARGLHEYLSEAHDVTQSPHFGAVEDTPPPRKTFRRIVSSLLVVSFGVFAIAGIVAFVSFSPAEEDALGRTFVIEPGTPLTEIVRALEDEGFIKNYWSVALLLRAQGKEGTVKAGEFTLSSAMSPQKIVAILTDAAPPKEDVEVTIPEGFSVYQIADRLVETGLFETSREVLDAPVDLSAFPFVDIGSCSAGGGETCRVRFRSLEGYLFPDTYRFDTDSTFQDVAEKMLKNFSAKFDEALRAEAAARDIPLRSLVIRASLVEEEAVSDSDRGLIAGVIAQRLSIGMLLQVDATVLYAREQVARAIPGARFETLNRELTFTDLEIDSPYNTYRYANLPPGPIANPGLAALLAALRPEMSEYLFYLHDADGVAYFARTNEEHVANKIRYLGR